MGGNRKTGLFYSHCLPIWHSKHLDNGSNKKVFDKNRRQFQIYSLFPVVSQFKTYRQGGGRTQLRNIDVNFRQAGNKRHFFKTNTQHSCI